MGKKLPEGLEISFIYKSIIYYLIKNQKIGEKILLKRLFFCSNHIFGVIRSLGACVCFIIITQVVLHYISMHTQFLDKKSDDPFTRQ
jgi:hypothetical protein